MIMFRQGDAGQGVETLNKNLIILGTTDVNLLPDISHFTSVTEMAVKRFQDDHDLDVDGIVGPDTLAAIQKELKKAPTPPILSQPPGTPLAVRLVNAMKNKNFQLFLGIDVINIIYVEGMNVDGRPNAHTPNTFEDTRIVLQVPTLISPKVLAIYEATTRPGKYWTQHPMNRKGAAHLRLGQQTGWIVGTYHDMPALIQDGYLELYRDPDEKYVRYGPLYKQNDTGIHHHGGYDYPHDDLGRSSAGCQVGRLMAGHREFINKYVKSDARYIADHSFHFTSTILEYADLPA